MIKNIYIYMQVGIARNESIFHIHRVIIISIILNNYLFSEKTDWCVQLSIVLVQRIKLPSIFQKSECSLQGIKLSLFFFLFFFFSLKHVNISLGKTACVFTKSGNIIFLSPPFSLSFFLFFFFYRVDILYAAVQI